MPQGSSDAAIGQPDPTSEAGLLRNHSQIAGWPSANVSNLFDKNTVIISFRSQTVIMPSYPSDTLYGYDDNESSQIGVTAQNMTTPLLI